MTVSSIILLSLLAVNGILAGEWTQWSKCSKPSGYGTRTRVKYSGGYKHEQAGVCCLSRCPVNGRLSGWSAWGTCDKPCGSGSQVRTKSCNSPSPKYGGRDCRWQGATKESRACNTQKCPTNENAKWESVNTGGKWCNHPRVETSVRPATPDACKEYCEKKGKQYCMWDYGTGDGFCMASDECSKQLMAGDRRRYTVWKKEGSTNGESKCPESHPYAYLNGDFCCKYDHERVYKGDGARCDGGPIGIDSSCCRDNKHVRCPHGKCTSTVPPKWRTDSRCGSKYRLPNGDPAECNPKSDRPCCSNHGWCGHTDAHCKCGKCTDYRKNPCEVMLD